MMIKKFTVECEMEERWVDYFCSMLKHMQTLGVKGKADYVAMFVDGDGDFRPSFNIETDYNTVKPTDDEFTKETGIVAYDAG